LCLGSVSWAAGSIYMRNVRMPRSALRSNAIQMLAGGAGLVFAAAVTGELGRIDLAGASPRALASVAYLIVFGSLIGYTAYTYILRVSTPARVSTYAYVNPVVAVFLGWALAGEAVTMRTLAAAGVILGGVAIITMSGAAARRR
jgi:drug/metabolite transporter (DMT)-like permease